MTLVKVNHARFGNRMPVGLNGQPRALPLGTEIELSDEMIEHLRGLGASVEVVSKRADPPVEGSGGGSALPSAKPKARKKANKKTTKK